MKPYEITAQDAAEFTHLSFGDEEYTALDDKIKVQLKTTLEAAKGYVSGYTGLDLTEAAGLDLPDISIAILVVASEMWDNRQLTTQYTGQNPMVMQILGMRSTNLLPTPDTV